MLTVKPFHWSESILAQFNVQPERPLRKLPFQRVVLDKNNDMFRFIIRDKKAKYEYVHSTCAAHE